jgi:nitroreductase
MGIPPSDVQAVVLKGKENVREFSWDFIDLLGKSKPWFSPFSLALMRPFMNRQDYEMTRSFIPPLIDIMQKGKKEEKNWLLYDAPLAIYFNAWLTDPADPFINATYAMLAAESLGLGSCMIGSIGPFIRYGSKKFKQKWGIHPHTRYGLMVVFGYPKFRFHKAIRRSLARVQQF